MKKKRILIVEDEAITGMALVEEVTKLGYGVVGKPITTGEEAIEVAEKEKPDLILMDIVLRGKIDGVQAANEIFAKINKPIIYVTAYAEQKLLNRAKATKPFGYIVKPFSARELYRNIEIALYKHQIEIELENNYKNLKKIFLQAINAMAAIVATKNREFEIHQHNVAKLAVAIAKELKLEEGEIEAIEIAALVHAVGLIGLSNDLLRNAKNFRKEEEALYQRYPEYGYEILKNIKFPWPIAEIVLQHRELLDGSGFPNGLKKAKILFPAKILGVAFFVDNNICGGLTGKKLSINDTIKELEKNKGKLFNEDIVAACIKILKSKECMLVKCESDGEHVE